MELLQFVQDNGLQVGIVLFFIYRDYLREEKNNLQIAKLQAYIQDELTKIAVSAVKALENSSSLGVRILNYIGANNEPRHSDDPENLVQTQERRRASGGTVHG